MYFFHYQFCIKDKTSTFAQHCEDDAIVKHDSSSPPRAGYFVCGDVGVKVRTAMAVHTFIVLCSPVLYVLCVRCRRLCRDMTFILRKDEIKKGIFIGYPVDIVFFP